MSKKGKSRGPIIAVVIICILLVAGMAAGGAAYYFCFRPIVKVNKAIEAEDYQTVSDLFDKLKDDEKHTIQNKMLDIAIDARKAYEKDEADYDEVIELYDLLDEKVLEDDDDLERNRQKIEELKSSHDSFDAGKAAMEAEEYIEAIEDFKQVIEKDNHYDEAQELIEECKALLPVDVIGIWGAEFDCGPVIASYAGLSDSLVPELMLPIKCEFVTEDSGKMYISRDDIYKIMDSVIELAMPLIIKQYCNKYGVTEKELNLMCKMMYGKDVETYASEQAKAMVEDKLSTTEIAFTYETEANIITARDKSGSQVIFELDGDKLFMTECSDGDFKKLEEYGVKLPIEFVREE